MGARSSKTRYRSVSSSSSNNNDNNAVDVSELNEQELNMYSSERLSKYKFTISVCIIYGILAIILLVLALFTEWGNRVLYDKMAAFVFTYIIGTIIIIVYLSNEIYNLRPQKIESKMPYDSHMCPDYWKLQKTNTADFLDSKGANFIDSKSNPNHFSYKCVLDDTVFNKQKFKELDDKKADANKKKYRIDNANNLYVGINKKESIGINDDVQFDEFKKLAASMNGYTYLNGSLKKNNDLALVGKNETFDGNNVPLRCDNVYPLYLSVYDNENAKKNSLEPTNKYRCAYAKACGITWSEAGCA